MPEAATAPETMVEKLVGEGLISMSAAARLYGQARSGVPTHRSTPARHAIKGVRLSDGRLLRLESVRVNGQLRTSRAAVLRFIVAQNEPATLPAGTTTPEPHASLTRARHEADKVLDAAGI